MEPPGLFPELLETYKQEKRDLGQGGEHGQSPIERQRLHFEDVLHTVENKTSKPITDMLNQNTFISWHVLDVY